MTMRSETTPWLRRRATSSPPTITKVSERLLNQANYYSILITTPHYLHDEAQSATNVNVQLRPPKKHVEVDTGAKVEDVVYSSWMKENVYEDEIRLFHIPFFILFVSVIEGGIFVYHVFNLNEEHCTSIRADGPLPRCSVFIFDPYRRYETWRYVSYMLVHSGYVHVVCNLLVQLLIGLPLEVVHGPLRVGAVYMAGVLSGSLITSVVDVGVFLCGASAGVYALIAAHLPVLILNWRHMHTVVEWAVSLVVITIGVLDLGWAIYTRYVHSELSDERIAYAAHLAGMAAGLLVGINVLGNDKYVAHWRTRRLICLACYGVWSGAVLMGLLVNLLADLVVPNFFPDLDLSELNSCRYHDQNGCYAVF